MAHDVEDRRRSIAGAIAMELLRGPYGQSTTLLAANQSEPMDMREIIARISRVLQLKGL